MPWRRSDIMSERIKFIARLLDGERMSDLCQEFEISRKTGYKLHDRFKAEGLEGLSDKPRLPIHRPNQTPVKIEQLIQDLRLAHPTWGSPKIKEYLQRKYGELKIPASSTIHCILEKNNLINKKKRIKLYKAEGTGLSEALAPNDLWCADFKGQFRMGNQQYCYPLTTTDQLSRMLLCCEALENVKEDPALNAFERTFLEYGLPARIRTDNGVPFASRSLFGLSLLSVWWLRLGILIERIEPGHPEQNGRHERMHRTLKETVLKPPAKNILQQQEKFDEFCATFNHERPHQGIQMKCPSDLYQKSSRTYPEVLGDLEYPQHEGSCRVSGCGSIVVQKNKRVFISEVFRHQILGLKQVEEQLWQVDFMNYTLGFYDGESSRMSHAENPFLLT